MVHNLADTSRVLSQPVSYIATATENNQRPILVTSSAVSIRNHLAVLRWMAYTVGKTPVNKNI
jgi:hypothetical protein